MYGYDMMDDPAPKRDPMKVEVFVVRFDSQEWPEYNRVLGVFLTKHEAIQEVHRATYQDWQNHKSARSRPMQDKLYYHIEEFDLTFPG